MKAEAASVREAVQWTLSNGFVAKDNDPMNAYNTSTLGELITEYIYGNIPDSKQKLNMEFSKSTII